MQISAHQSLEVDVTDTVVYAVKINGSTVATEPGEGDWLMHTFKCIGYTYQHEAIQMKEELALLVICHKHFTYLSPNT